MKRVLIVAYYFPPLGGIGSLRIARFAEHLPAYGWEPTVLTPRNGAYFRDDTLTFPEERVLRTASIELSRAGKQLLRAGGSDTEAAAVRGARARLKELARRHLYFPDAQIGWLPPALLSARRRVHAGEFDAVFSSSFPITAHLIARRIHRRLGTPWVAEFRDPWSAMLPSDSPVITRAQRLEAEIGREASALVTVSPSWASMFGSAWSREVHVIRNGHDGVPATTSEADGRFTLGYLGTYYPGTQDLRTMWEAVRVFNSGASGRLDAIRLIGPPQPGLLREIADVGLSGLVEQTGFLAHDRAADELLRCSVLLVAGPKHADPVLRGHVVAKLSEYLATQKPIIYVGQPFTDAAALISAHAGTQVVPPGDVAGAVRSITEARDVSFVRDSDALSRARLTAHLADLLDEIGAR